MVICGTTIGVIKGDIRSLDNGSNFQVPREQKLPQEVPSPVCRNLFRLKINTMRMLGPFGINTGLPCEISFPKKMRADFATGFGETV